MAFLGHDLVHPCVADEDVAPGRTLRTGVATEPLTIDATALLTYVLLTERPVVSIETDETVHKGDAVVTRS